MRNAKRFDDRITIGGVLTSLDATLRASRINLGLEEPSQEGGI